MVQKRRLQLMLILLDGAERADSRQASNDLDTDMLAAMEGPAGYLAGHPAGGLATTVISWSA